MIPLLSIRAGDATEKMTICEGSVRFVVKDVHHHEPNPGAKSFGRAQVGQVWITGRVNKGEGTRVYDIDERVDVLR